MGPLWGQQDPGGPHVGSMNLAIWVSSINCSNSVHMWLSWCVAPTSQCVFVIKKLIWYHDRFWEKSMEGIFMYMFISVILFLGMHWWPSYKPRVLVHNSLIRFTTFFIFAIWLHISRGKYLRSMIIRSWVMDTPILGFTCREQNRCHTSLTLRKHSTQHQSGPWQCLGGICKAKNPQLRWSVCIFSCAIFSQSTLQTHPVEAMYHKCICFCVFRAVTNWFHKLNHWGQVTHICVGNITKLFQTMACPLNGAKPLSAPMLECC